MKKLILKALLLLVIIVSIAGLVYALMCMLGVNTVQGLQSICNGNPWLSYTIIILLQIIQVVFIPISNQIITIPAIVVLGIFPAFFCSWIGIEIGTIILYFIGNKGGGRLLCWLLSDKEKAERFAGLIKTRKLFYPIGMLIGVIPDDILTTVAGLSKLNFFYVLIVSILTRGICVGFTVFGFGVLTKTWWGIAILASGILTICVLGYLFLRYEPKIEEWFAKKFKKN